MISNKSMHELHKIIKKYDNLVGRTYLIAFRKEKTEELEFIEIKIEKRNFWHLLACKLSSSQHDIFYEKCLKGEDISNNLEYVVGHNEQDVIKKSNIINDVFDFISNAKSTKISFTGEYNFKLAIGSLLGIIGYDTNDKVYYPRSAQNKDINKLLVNSYSPRKSHKISIILSKENTENSKYDKIDFEAGKNLFAKLSDQFKKFPLSKELNDIISEYKKTLNTIPQDLGYAKAGFGKEKSNKNVDPIIKQYSGFRIENLTKFKNIASQIPKDENYIIGSLREINIKEINNDTFEIELIYDDNENDDI